LPDAAEAMDSLGDVERRPIDLRADIFSVWALRHFYILHFK
jgi:hypothetical protein